MQLAAPLTLQAPSDLGLDTGRQWGRTLSSRGDLYGRNGGVGTACASTSPATRSRAMFRGAMRLQSSTSAAPASTLGAEYGLGEGIVGIAGNYSNPRAEFGNESARDSGHSWQIGAYGSIDVGGLFGQGYLGYGKDHNKIRRAGVVDDMNASPTATTRRRRERRLSDVIRSAAGGTGGRARLCARQGRRLYGEWRSCADADVGSQSLKSLTGQIGLEARGSFSGFHPFVDLTAEHEFVTTTG